MLPKASLIEIWGRGAGRTDGQWTWVSTTDAGSPGRAGRLFLEVFGFPNLEVGGSVARGHIQIMGDTETLKMTN